MIRVRDGEGTQQVDRATQALVPTVSPGTLPTDPKHLDAMFVFCTNNWRTYAGEKPQGDKLARINAVHKQATLGDCTDKDWATPFDKTVLRMWRSYSGTPALMAKRRFLALLRDVDPRLLQIKAYQFSPWGFPTTAKGERICPYSNAKKGCPRPLMDKYGHNLEHEIDNNESLSEFTNLKKWLDEVGAQQRCAMGLHTPISAEAGARFSTFFARPECGGFQQYTQAKIHNMVNKVLTKQLMAYVEMQNNPRNFSKIAQAHQRDRVVGLQQYYTALTGREFSNEVLCSRDSHHCETRRLAEGANHTHPVVVRQPPTDLSLYDALIQVRRECVRLGVVPATGPVHSIDHRCLLLQMKVVDFHRKQMLVYESQRRQQWRADILPHDAAMLKTFSRSHRAACLRHALDAKDMGRVCLVVESGADPSTELRSGLFPLMAAVLKRSIPDIRRLLAAGADLDAGNSKGMTALMWAVKRGDYGMVDALLEEGADVSVEGCSGWTAMSIASRHGRRDIAQLIVEHLREDKVSGEMNADRVLNHRSRANAGLTPVAVAAIHRNEVMARCLMRLGARPAVRCRQGYVAGEHASRAGWTVFGLWLQETQAFGANGVYTFADMNAESALRVAAVRMLDAISSGATVEDASKKTGSRPTSAASKKSGGGGGGSRPGSAIAISRGSNSSNKQVLLSSAAIKNSSNNSSRAIPPISVSVPQLTTKEPENTAALVPEVPLPPPQPLIPSPEPDAVGVPDAVGRGERPASVGFFDATKFQLEQVRSNTLLTVSVLQEGRAAPDTETEQGHTALMSAVYRGRPSAVRSLIQEGADPNYSNRNGRTALMAAAAAGDREVALTLLRHGADAAPLDIHGKVAGAYAFERGFAELAELLAVAASDGHEAAVDWEIDRSRREEEEKERQGMEDLLERVGGGGGGGRGGGGRGDGDGGGDVPGEADLHDWMIRVTKPRECARLADKKEADLIQQQKNKMTGSKVGASNTNSSNVSLGQQEQRQRRRARCPKCTLFVPCLHFAGTELPDGVYEWEAWGKGSVVSRSSKGATNNNNHQGGGRRGGGRGTRKGLVDLRNAEKGVSWWRDLHQAHRDRTLPPPATAAAAVATAAKD